MTAKEEAKELVDKFEILEDGLYTLSGKKCALVALEEKQKFIHKEYLRLLGEEDMLKEVKREIKKL
jgi:hypothetical protein